MIFLRDQPETGGTMRQRAFGTLSLLAALLITSSWALADDVRTSKAAYGDWQTDAPCVMRKITANDLNPPRMRRDANSTPWSITKASGTAGPRPTLPVLRRTHVCHRDLRGRQATPSADQALSLRGPTLTTDFKDIVIDYIELRFGHWRCRPQRGGAGNADSGECGQ
jgi:hypothetical protein